MTLAKLNEKYEKAHNEEKKAFELVFSLKAELQKAAPEARAEIGDRIDSACRQLAGAMIESTEAWRSYSALPGER